MISFGVGLPGPPVYGTTVEIENGPTLFWDGHHWGQPPRKHPTAVSEEMADSYATDADHEAAMGFPSPAEARAMNEYSEEASQTDGVRAITDTDEYEMVTLRFRGGWPTATSREIMEEHLRRWFELFMEKQVDYGDRGDDLGLAGQYAELHRKIGKLKRAMWDGVDLAGEPLEQVLLDMIGHCFLSLRFVKHHNTGGKGQK